MHGCWSREEWAQHRCKERKNKKTFKKLRLSRLFREWYGMQDEDYYDMLAMWRERGESEEEIEKVKQHVADLFDGKWISVTER